MVLTIKDILSIVLPVLVPLLGVTWWFSSKFTRIDVRLGAINKSLQVLASFAGLVIGTGIISSEKMGDLIKQAVNFDTIEREFGKANPLTPEELTKLRYYIGKAKMGIPFIRDEAIEFYFLSQKVSKERETEGSSLLALLAGFILGMWVGSKK